MENKCNCDYGFKPNFNVYKGVTNFGLLGVLLVGLKILGYTTMSWWIVLAPFYISFIAKFICISFLSILVIDIYEKIKNFFNEDHELNMVIDFVDNDNDNNEQSDECKKSTQNKSRKKKSKNANKSDKSDESTNN